MAATHFEHEDYLLYCLGILEEDQRIAVNEHVRDRCTICLQHIGAGYDFWGLFAMHVTPMTMDRVARPSVGARNRLLHSIRPPKKAYILPPAWTWTRAAAGILVLVGTGTITWYTSQRSFKEPAVLVANVPVATAPTVVVPPSTVPTGPPQPQPQVIVTQPPPPVQNDQLEAQVRTLTTEKTQLENELRTGRDQIARLTKEREDLIAQSRNSDEVTRRLAELERVRDGLNTRLRELELLNAEYRDTIELQKRRIGQESLIATALATPGVRLVKLDPTTAGEKARGSALIAGGNLVFYASNMPALKAGRTYQLWVIRGKSPAIVSAGTFSLSPSDAPAVRMTNSPMLVDVRGLAVTEEPAGGSALPTGHKLLVGTPSRG